jgi:hypothetical protein
MVTLDPNLVRLLSEQPSDGQVRVDIIHKGVQHHLIESHKVEYLDEQALVKKKEKIVHGAVPHIQIKAHKVQNKKITQVGGFGNTLDLY